jgi:2-dehydro-3-deoxygluconokinase
VLVTVVDSVGAGDAFVAGYLSEFAKGHNTSHALELGAFLGAAACRHPGDWEGAADWLDLISHDA